MNTTHRFSLFLFLQIISLILISCQREDERLGSLSGQKEFVLHASQEADYSLGDQYDADTKSVLQADGKVFWSPGDSISFFIGKGHNGGYPLVSSNSAVSSEADFVGTIANCSDHSTFYAIYPYNSDASCDGTFLNTVLPSEQTAVEGSFADDLFISVAASKNDKMKFYHVCGGFKFSVVGEGINRVVFTNPNGSYLAGNLEIKFDESGLPVVTGISGGSDAITVNAPAGGTFSPGKYYYAVLPPTKFTQGIKITYYRDSANCIFRTANEFEVKRAIFGRVYDKDEGLKYRKTVNAYGRLDRSQMLPSGVNKETITEMLFFTNSTENTDVLISSGSGEDERPIYFKLEGTIAKYYTEADCYSSSSMFGMFMDYSALECLDLRNWDTSEVLEMDMLFSGCKKLKSIDLSSFITSNVTSFFGMFYGCESLESLDLGNFDTSHISNFNILFYGCKSLKTLDLTSFNTSMADSFNNTFQGCENLVSINLDSFNTSNANSFSQMFWNCKSLESLDVSRLDISKATDIGGMFYGCETLASIDLSHFNSANVTDFSFLFYGCKNLETLDVSRMDVSKAIEIGGMFWGCKKLVSLDISTFNTSNVLSMAAMFVDCQLLKTLDLTTFDTSKVTDMHSMFLGCTELESVDMTGFDTSNVTNMSGMFMNCINLASISGLSGFNTSKVTDMYLMFGACWSIASLDVSHFDTSNVTNMSAMFSGCVSLTELDLKNFNTSKVTDISAMFYECFNLVSLDLSSFDTANVTDMSYLIADDSNLISVDFSSFNTEKVEDMTAMFQRCKSLQVIDLYNFATPSLKHIDYMFTICSGLKLLNLSNFDLTSVTSLHVACNEIGSNVKSCKIICSSATKQVLQNEDTFLAYTEDKIRWYLDGAVPGDDDDDEKLYESTDYSMDGKYAVLQKASVGKGVDIVFIGDAYSDRLIADGTYENRMKSAMEQFFAEEPYKSLRNMFNVYEVYAVSQNETTDGITALNTYFGDGTTVGGNNSKAMSYACGVNSIDDLDNVLINVIVNQKKYAGTAYMYYPSSGDYGSGLSITYTPLGRTEEEFGNTLRHEAGGHGFAKLTDEYYYDYRGDIPQSEKEDITNNLSPYGWYKNVDFTDNLSDIKWSRFVSDTRYSSQNIGAYLGGATYPYGVWRPTEFSIMRYNTDGFNAPSREAIYYRINKLAYGESWEYNYETFVDFDRNTFGSSAAAKVQKAPYVHSFQPTAPPIVVKENWRTLLKSYENRSTKKAVDPMKLFIKKEILPPLI